MEALTSHEDIRKNLCAFVERYRDFQGTEAAEAKPFLEALFACFGIDRKAVGAQFEAISRKGADARSTFMDLYWPGKVIIEMKRPRESARLDRHRAQALGYWADVSDADNNIESPPYMMLCSFHKFEIWQPGKYPREPRLTFDLVELPDTFESLAFLIDEVPVFSGPGAELTQRAAKHVTDVYLALANRLVDVERKQLREFMVQTIWCLFAEDLELLPGKALETLLAELHIRPTFDSSVQLGGLFEMLNRPPADRTKGTKWSNVPYVNGQLFKNPAHIDLVASEIAGLQAASRFNWRGVNPTIFGALLEGALERSERWGLGAHYTAEPDILKIVNPTIVNPWRERIDSAANLDEIVSVYRQLCDFTVLDPACGCGNFLFVAYRELRQLEQRAKQRLDELAAASGQAKPTDLPLGYPIRNIHGIEFQETAALIAKLTMWMGHKLLADRFGVVEPVLPLTDLPGMIAGDALALDWPVVDAIIGNPPFHGASYMRRSLGDDMVDAISKRFGVGVQDHCVYWFRKAAEVMRPGDRAGFVATNSISQNRGRKNGLDYVIARGGVITDAVSTQVWSGEANVHVSIVNWILQPATPVAEFVLDDAYVDGIGTDLRAIGSSAVGAARLDANQGRSFEGPSPKASGFVLKPSEAEMLLSLDPRNAEVVKPYLSGKDITTEIGAKPSRWIIDFDEMPLEVASTYVEPMRIVRERVKPVRDTNREERQRLQWWKLARSRPEMREAIKGLSRYIVLPRVAKRVNVIWGDASWIPSDKTTVFAFDDEYAFGVLASSAHDAWAWATSTTLKSDLSYTPTTAFGTFPWPDPVDAAVRDRIAEAARDICVERDKILAEHQIGLTKIYNMVDDGGFQDLNVAHQRLNVAVAEAYGWPKSIVAADDSANQMVQRLLKLNAEIANGQRPYNPFS